jgi:predicted RND superfamily exporter protein
VFHRHRLIIILLLVVGISITGLMRLRFETNILEVLPQNLPCVEALKVSQEQFGNDQQVVVLLQSEGEGVDEEDVADLAAHLREKLPGAKVLYKSELEEDPAAFGKALAEIWRYAPPADVKLMSSRLLDKEALESHIGKVMAEIRGSFDQEKSTMAAYDPLGFLGHPVIRGFIESGISFQSDDGKSRILLIQNPRPTTDYHVDAARLGDIRLAIQNWPGMKELGLSFALTGGPVFNAEIGAGMEKDMSGTILLTSVLIGLLFLIVQRHPGQLLMISLQLALTFVITMGIGGWVFGTLNLVSVGFAAILLGLVVDYGVVIARESIGGFVSPGALRRELAPGIIWAALTTAIVFGLLTLSAFNGVRQLGGLVVIGLIAGVSVMLVFTPMFLGKYPSKKAKQMLKPPFFGAVAVRWTMAACALVAVGVFVTKGEPGISFNFSMVQPDSSEAAATFSRIQEKFPAWSDRNLQMIATADSWEELREAAGVAQDRLLKLSRDGVVLNYQWPVELIPDSVAEKENQQALAEISGKRVEIIQTLESQGFSQSGVAVDKIVLETLSGTQNPADAKALTKHFLVQTPGGKYHLAGNLTVAKPVTVENIGMLDPLFTDKFTLTGWSVIQAVLQPRVKKDFLMIFLPATAVLLLTLVGIFRSFRDAAISISVLLISLALVNAIVAATGQTWNFLSVMAIPLIVGTGIDYSIHLIFALRRSGGDQGQVWNGVGKAIFFCGVSTAIGFGSLLFSSNEMLWSMGLLCGLGILITTALSLFVIPGLWQRRGQ